MGTKLINVNIVFKTIIRELNECKVKLEIIIRFQDLPKTTLGNAERSKRRGIKDNVNIF
jgi:hypothetical protein